jgi:hypothetical protein
MTEFIGLFDTTPNFISHIIVAHTLVYTVMYSVPLFSSGFQWKAFSFLWVSERSQSSATGF